MLAQPSEVRVCLAEDSSKERGLGTAMASQMNINGRRGVQKLMCSYTNRQEFLEAKWLRIVSLRMLTVRWICSVRSSTAAIVAVRVRVVTHQGQQAVRSFCCLLVHSFVRSIVRSSVHSFVHVLM